MRVIFSRKGLDSAAGGCPSPIIDGRPVSVCIPTKRPTPICYAELEGGIADMVHELSRGRLLPNTQCHLDPDLDPGALPRPPGWRGALGQVGAAQSHLDNQGVGPGDIFVFWGLFRHAEHDGRWRFVGKPEHRVFGWLQVEEVLRIGGDPADALAKHPWISNHPHARAGWEASNTVYVASRVLRLGEEDVGLPGWSVCKRGHRLTAPGRRPSFWTVPDWLNPKRGGTGMTYHSTASFEADGLMRAAARGQEFIADVTGRRDALDWLRELLEPEA